MDTIDRTAGSSSTPPGGRQRGRQLLVTAACLLFAAAGLQASVSLDAQVTVREESGVYVVTATFGVSQPASIAFAVLTDYEQIPRFMPDIRTSHVLERSEHQAIIEQEAVARFMMFSKRVHLVLEVHEHPGTIRFRDRCGQSFARYEGGWTITEQDGHTAIMYELTAKPSFDVPEFVLKRLLTRDATQMIERLQAAIAERTRSLQE